MEPERLGNLFVLIGTVLLPIFIFRKNISCRLQSCKCIVTRRKIGETIKKKFGSIQFSTTHQGHSLGIAASLGVQKIIQNEIFLKEVQKKGDYFRKTISQELKNYDFFKNIRGRGMRNSVEYNCDNNHLFGCALTELAKNELNLLISAKWHRVCFLKLSIFPGKT